MLGPELITGMLKLCGEIDSQIDHVKANKNHCAALARRSRLVSSLLQSKQSELKQLDQHSLAILENLYRDLQDCQRFILKFSGNQWAKNVLKARKYTARFSELNRNFDSRMIELNSMLGLHYLPPKPDLKALEADNSDLQARVAEILGQLRATNGQTMRNRAVDQLQQESLKLALGGREMVPASFPEEKLITWCDIGFERLLREDGGIETYLGSWNGETVAVKVLSLRSDTERRRLAHEIKVLSRLHHPNIIDCHGGSFVPRMGLVMEYMDRGSLWSCLEGGCPKEEQQWRFMLAITKGLAYLHENSVTHGNLCSANVLLNSADEIKLADFGLSAGAMISAVDYSAGQDSLAWMSPQRLLGETATMADDIYALGMLFWEIITGQRPYSNLSSEQIVQKVKAGSREVLTACIASPIADVIRRSWQLDRSKRPAVAEVLEVLQNHAPDQQLRLSPDAWYKRGVELERMHDDTGAVKAYQHAADGNYPRAHTNLATFFREGRGGVTKDSYRAICHLKVAAKAGHPRAQYNLGRMLRLGDGVSQNLNRSCFWLEIASQNTTATPEARAAAENQLAKVHAMMGS